MEIDNYNVDDIVFLDKDIQKELQHLKPLFDQWLLGTKVPALRFLAQKSQLEMLEKLSTENNRAILERYFKESISVQTIDYRVVKHYSFPLNEAEKMLNETAGMVKNISVSRNAERVYVSLWR